MNKSKTNTQKRRVNGAYFTSVISVSLVLFTLGFLGLIMLYANNLSNYIKENIGFEIVMKTDVKEADIIKLQKHLDTKNFVKTTEYITSEEASKRLKKILGDDFVDFMSEDDNPLLPSIDIRLNANWANNDSLAVIEQYIMEDDNVKEVYYQKSMVNIINKNLRKIGLVMLAFSILLLIIAIALINNTIRLSVYSKRFTIRSMQLVGATEAFIRKPFVIKGILQGSISAALAILLLLGIIEVLRQNIPELRLISDNLTLIYLFVAILICGLILTGLSTATAVSKYLRMDSDKLYA
ncbi:MAG: cell division protein FtsX [Marinilabiliales bacterium]|mgnify:CR=1 FL=1|nr:MAG: cell division protein FtsX [Marinilabiliales bacterium]